MEFNEKLQHLRKQQNMTQEELAEKLYVSRAAVSKWESGRGYPNIDSLKAISSLFNITIDELLSSNELLEIAETENRSNINGLYNIICGICDILAVLFILLPLYGKTEGDTVYSVNLISYKGATKSITTVYWIIFITMIIIGAVKLIALYLKKDTLSSLLSKISVGISAAAICIFAVTRAPYATLLLFILLSIKIILFFKELKSK
ncbi:MAG: helix-turn-helix domain-containing protein [Lachnospiraceae bacterium]|nr:helix-turn-helix domain-containing protein [Lachnospiraceae bacterium]